MDVHVRLEVARRREGLLADLALVRLLLKERGKEEFMKNIDNLEASMGIINTSNLGMFHDVSSEITLQYIM